LEHKEAGMIEIKLKEGITITEETVLHIFPDGSKKQIYEYFIGDTFIFGVEKRFSLDDLEALYSNGYFDAFMNNL
jgi:hypothetical protein